MLRYYSWESCRLFHTNWRKIHRLCEIWRWFHKDAFLQNGRHLRFSCFCCSVVNIFPGTFIWLLYSTHSLDGEKRVVCVCYFGSFHRRKGTVSMLTSFFLTFMNVGGGRVMPTEKGSFRPTHFSASPRHPLQRLSLLSNSFTMLSQHSFCILLAVTMVSYYYTQKHPKYY